jgi:hypothetical protein
MRPRPLGDSSYSPEPVGDLEQRNSLLTSGNPSTTPRPYTLQPSHYTDWAVPTKVEGAEFNTVASGLRQTDGLYYKDLTVTVTVL